MRDTSDIVVWMHKRLEADKGLGTHAGLLVLASLEGEAALNDLQGYEPPSQAADEEAAHEPAGAFLSTITVQGFRGIGEASTLSLRAGPGLTIVAGRNGSGKSSFAEALEMALTQTTYRWRERSSLWQEAWRNVHFGASTEIDVTLVEESVGDTRISLKWDENADWNNASCTLQRKGEKREPGLDGLGWAGPIQTYRPLMSYDELGAILGSEPSKLHDALSKVLGIEQVSTAVRLLTEHHKNLSVASAALARAKSDAKAALEDVVDPRGAAAGRLLRATIPDTKALSELVTSLGDADEGTVGLLRRVLVLELPPIEQVDAAATALVGAVAGLASSGDAAATSLELRADLLRNALALHGHAGDQRCPVCGEGALTDEWAAQTKMILGEGDAQLADLRAAQSTLAAARRSCQALLTQTPAALTAQSIEGLETEWEAARAAWSHWAVAPESDLHLADHLTDARLMVGESLDALQSRARTVLAQVESAWTPVAARIGAVIAAAEDAARMTPERDQAEAALKWLKSNESALKNERLQPITERAAHIWSLLRQESNVEIAGMRLEGTATRRRVTIDTTIDGSEAAGIAVLSQGELHALALALFLPRATMPGSPFRFVVLDDPVQAMDPSKIDGLVLVLSEIAETRQVVVFSHDDRLAAAVRRSPIDAHIMEVTRGSYSSVTVRETKSPAARYLDDARAINADVKLPDATRRRVLPGLLRLAAEAQSRDRYFSDRLARGEPIATTESSWADTHQTRHRIALALYGDTRSLDAWLDKKPARRRALGVCTSAIHDGLVGDVGLAVEDVGKLVDDIQIGAR